MVNETSKDEKKRRREEKTRRREREKRGACMEEEEAKVQAHEEGKRACANGWKERERPKPRILVRPIDGRLNATNK